MKVKNMEDIEIIMQLEGGELIIEDFEDLEKLKNICKKLANSQGFYGRLLRDIEAANIEESNFPIIF